VYGGIYKRLDNLEMSQYCANIEDKLMSFSMAHGDGEDDQQTSKCQNLLKTIPVMHEQTERKMEKKFDEIREDYTAQMTIMANDSTSENTRVMTSIKDLK
jgi:hypothetical protein